MTTQCVADTDARFALESQETRAQEEMESGQHGFLPK